jgi:pyrroloquinoline quinone (PQQ) biosynthesis protein C
MIEKSEAYVQKIAHFSITGRDDRLVGKRGLDAELARTLTGAGDSLAFEHKMNALQHHAYDLLGPAFAEDNDSALLEIHKALFLIYELNFINPLHPSARHQFAPSLERLRQWIEELWLSHDIAKVTDDLPSPDDLERPEKIVGWFKYQANRRSPNDLRIEEFLEHFMTLEDLKKFILTDGYLNYRFYDAVILAAPSYADFVRQEISKQIWEECGEGDIHGAHTNQFTQSLQTLGLELPRVPNWTNWRPYYGFNLYFMLGMRRRHYFKALGSLAMPELFDPARNRALNAGLRRLGFSPERDFHYYFIHEKVDVRHGKEWLSNIIEPIVREQPAAGRELALGAALRMLAFRHYNSYLADLFGLEKPRRRSDFH